MNTTKPTYLVINAPVGADVTAAARLLTLGQNANAFGPINLLNLVTSTEAVAVAATAGVIKAKMAAFAAEITYFWQIQQFIGGQYRTVPVSYTAQKTGDTLATCRAGMIAVINTLNKAGQLNCTAAADGANADEINVTAAITNPIIVGKNVSNMTITVTTAGVSPIGQGADLLAQNFETVSEVPVSGTSYDSVILEYSAQINGLNTVERKQNQTLIMYYNNAAGAGLTAFKAALNGALHPDTTAELSAEVSINAADIA